MRGQFTAFVFSEGVCALPRPTTHIFMLQQHSIKFTKFEVASFFQDELHSSVHQLDVTTPAIRLPYRFQFTVHKTGLSTVIAVPGHVTHDYA